MDWTQLRIVIPAQETERASDIANMVVPYGIYIEDYRDLETDAREIAHIDLIDEDLLARDRTHSIIHIYISPEENPAEAMAFLQERYTAEGISHELLLDEVREEDWANNWKAYFKPFRLYDNIIIKPTWEEVPEDATDEDIVIEIDPGTAFGTGSHETTRLCIGQLKKYMKDGDEILDAGSGSGILSFVCNKLGAKHVLGIDIDPIAVDVAGENRDVNHIPAEAVEFKCGNVLEDQKLVESIGANYDIVVANILADVIIPMSAVVQKFMKDDGIFISSGIINIKEDEVRQALLDNNFDIVDTVYMNDWVSFVAKKHV